LQQEVMQKEGRKEGRKDMIKMEGGRSLGIQKLM
jgi:hypothetical protein